MCPPNGGHWLFVVCVFLIVFFLAFCSHLGGDIFVIRRRYPMFTVGLAKAGCRTALSAHIPLLVCVLGTETGLICLWIWHMLIFYLYKHKSHARPNVFGERSFRLFSGTDRRHRGPSYRQ